MNLTINWKAFIFAFIGVFLMVILPHFGVAFNPSTIFQNNPINQLISPQSDIDKVLKIKLQSTPKSNFRLHHSYNFIPTTFAAQDYQNATSYAVIDLSDGQIIDSKEFATSLPIASLTKLMSSIVALDLSHPEERFYVSLYAASIEPTKIGVVPGQSLTLEELLQASLLTSANDAVEVIQEGINQKYQSSIFVEAMNQKAQFLGLNNTHFTNPQGFDHPDHYSSARDLAYLAQYALANYPLISDIVSLDYQFLPADHNHKQYDLYNWNGLIGIYPNTMGIKIGNTAHAQKTTMVVSYRNNHPLLAIVLGAPDIHSRDLWAAQLLDFAYQSKYQLPPVNITTDQLQTKYDSWRYWR